MDFEKVLRQVGRGASGCGGEGWLLASGVFLSALAGKAERVALLAYQRVEWTGLFSSAFDITYQSGPVAQAGVMAAGARFSVGGRPVASASLVLRTDRSGPGPIRDRVPAPPIPFGDRPMTRPVVISDTDVAHFLSHGTEKFPLFESPSAAWAAGLPNSIVPGLLLALEVLSGTTTTTDGVAEVWYRRPVPIGSALTVFTERQGNRYLLGLSGPGHTLDRSITVLFVDRANEPT